MKISTAGNVIVPAILAIESMGYSIKWDDKIVVAVKDDDQYCADDPLSLLGLIKLVETRSWEWGATDAEIEATLNRHKL